MQDPNTKNFQTLHKEIKEDLNKYRDIQRLWVEVLNIVNMAIPKFVYGFDATPVKILSDCC